MLLKKMLIYLTGITITYFGTALVVKSALGAGFWSALYVGLSDFIGLTVGFWFASFQFLIVLVNAYLKKQSIEWSAIVPIIIESVLFTFWLEFVLQNLNLTDAFMLTKISAFLTGMICASFGIALYIQTGFTRAPVDELFLAISQRFKLKIGLAQSFIASTVTLISFLIGGPVGIGTALTIFIFGPCIQFWYNRLSTVSVRYLSEAR
ncbi:YczE/YyaS/YitT family protein [Pontibacillus yanchengensis]|uniref:BCR, YitT family protein n=1 Tax=Pontibacillus yanchengensis Y32 TaxID=1385514 RepID=A0A0A2T825_9BACI|nr:hypothetical protein [Pontibacillus yanchengensis]KGP71937.1 hypothetical protein N782_14660 [Pontibacillus yanchengensis Y32]